MNRACRHHNALLKRRDFLKAAAGTAAAAAMPGCAGVLYSDGGWRAGAAILRATYDESILLEAIEAGLGLIEPPDVAGKRVLLKVNLVDLPRDNRPIVTDPAVIVAAAEAFRRRGAAEVLVADGPALQRDAWEIVEAVGLAGLLDEQHLTFADLSTADLAAVPNAGGLMGDLPTLYYSRPVLEADVIVSMPKMKTHHWAGVSLAMKNHFGMLSGLAHGWPRNQFHVRNLHHAVIDFLHTLRADYAIIDGVVGLEGDGPVRGTAIEAGVLVMGSNLPAVDATAARIMGVRPEAVDYLRMSAGVFGPIGEANITQLGEPIAAVRRPFRLMPHQWALAG